MNLPRILIVDDQEDIIFSLSRALKLAGLQAAIDGASQIAQAIKMFKELKPEVLVLDLSLDETLGVESGFNLLKEILLIDQGCRIIVLTGHASVDHGVRSLQLGAANFLEKPANIAHLLALINDGIVQAQLRREFTKIQASQNNISNILVGSSSKMKQVIESVLYAGQTNQPILITGETGTGKGACAQAIHDFGKRKKFNFVRYQTNFASADLVNSELFGHVKGSFTGATEDRRGLVAESNNGTLFLDEIDELPLDVQVTLLGVLQNKKFRSVGSTKEQEVDFRLICAFNRDIDQALESGKIRRDFYHRVAHSKIALPALRERLSDLPELVQFILHKINQREQINVLEINQNALLKLQNYNWPGNIRELEAVIEDSALRANFKQRSYIVDSDINLQIEMPTENDQQDFRNRVNAFELSLVQQALTRNQGNQVKAAQELGLNRVSLRRILARS